MVRSNLKKSEYLPLKIKKTDSGAVEWVVGMFFLLLLSIVMCTQLQLSVWQAAGMYLEDALAASNLASALIDLEEYGATGNVVIKTPEQAYQIYLDAVKENLSLDENWECRNKDLISGRVKIEDYVIYNVEEGNIMAYRVNEYGLVEETFGGRVGELKTPNGLKIENSGVYSEISFPIQGFFQLEVTAHKGQFVDVCVEEDEDEE